MADIERQQDIERLRSALNDAGDARSPAGLPSYRHCQLSTYDVSEVSLLRKRVGRAATSIKLVGTLSAVYAWVYLFDASPWTLFFAGAFGLLVYWCARQLSTHLKTGDLVAATLVAVWGFLWLALVLIDVFPEAISSGYAILDLTFPIRMLIFLLPIYFLARGLIALQAHRKREQNSTRNNQLLTVPWEAAGQAIKGHPAFANKRSLRMYSILPLVPLPWLFFAISARMQDTLPVDATFDMSFRAGKQMGQIEIALGMWVLSVYLYRRARRAALLPAAELSRRTSRQPILYLRSFHDDRIRMRARAANGRTLLESLLAIRFEEVVTDHLWRYGPVVAIGRPGDRLPPLGAAREYEPNERWQQKVEQLMLSASLIVVVAGRTGGLAWELKKLIDLGLIRKLIILFPPPAQDTLRSKWTSLYEQAGEAGLDLPQNIDLRRTRVMVLPKRYLAYAITSNARDDWSYETALDAVAELVDLPR